MTPKHAPSAADELRERLKNRMDKHVGTRDLREGNRRLAVLDEWRMENNS
jgi:hypothetical protein